MEKRGRKKGYKMSQASKNKISKTKTGSKHSERTKKRISDGVLRKNRTTITGIPIEIIMSVDIKDLSSSVCRRGYVDVSIPKEGGGTYKQRAHVFVIEKELGHKLLPGWEVHHRGAKTDNRRHMLQLCKSRKQHRALHFINIDTYSWVKYVTLWRNKRNLIVHTI